MIMLGDRTHPYTQTPNPTPWPHYLTHIGMQMYLTLPLPMDKTRTAEVNIVHVDGSKAPALHAVDVPKAGSVGDIYVAIAQV